MNFRFVESIWIFFFSMTVLSTFATRTTFEHCPKGWHYYDQRQRCILLEYKPLPWEQARVKCQEYGCDLTTIRDSQTSAFITGLIEEPNCAEYWIGLHDRNSEGVYQWLDENGATNFTYWAEGEPNNLGNEDCVFIAADKERHWNDAVCDAYIGYSCDCAARTPTPVVDTTITPKPVVDTTTMPKPVVDTTTTPTPVIDTITTPTPVIDTITTPTPVVDTTINTSIVGQCPDSWHYYHPRHRCFKHRIYYMSWTKAKDWCESYGHSSRLAIIPDIDTNNFLSGLVEDKQLSGIWIGLHRLNSTDFFQWLDEDVEVQFTNWGEGEPNTPYPNPACVYMNPRIGHWFDKDCTSVTAALLCEQAATFNDD